MSFFFGNRALGRFTLLVGVLLQVASWRPHTQLVVPQRSESHFQYSQSATAMCINSLTGQELRAEDIDAAYGYDLLRALNTECASVGVTWQDGGEIRPGWWDFLEEQVEEQGLPVTLALNGREFSPHPAGVVVVVVAVKWQWARIADPVTGRFRWVTRRQLESAEKHPDGNWMFYGTRQAPQRRASLR